MTNAETLAAEAVTNGAEPVAKTTASVLSRLTSATGNLGMGFLGIAISSTGAHIAWTSFKAAGKAVKP